MDPVKTGLLKNHPKLEILEIEIVSNYVSNIRSSVFKVLSILLEGEYIEVAKQLRRNIFYNLKVPQNDWDRTLVNTPFEQPEAKISNVYGEDIEEAVYEINRNLKQVVSCGNPMNAALHDFLTKPDANHKYVLYTESKFKGEFKILIDSFNLEAVDIRIISTTTEYKNLNEFHSLIFIGSIRIDEFTSLPNYFLRNIKFTQLVQLKWAGQKNDNTAFISPISRLRLLLSVEEITNISIPDQVTNQFFVLNGNLPDSERLQEDIDEFEVYKKLTLDSFPALCFKLSNEKTVFYSPNSKLIFIDDESNKPSVKHVKAIEAANLGNVSMYIASFNVTDKYLHDRDTRLGEYQMVWKNVLMDQDLESFLGELERSKMNLKNIRSCVSDWCEISVNVVKAPQEKENFLVLLGCLKFELMSFLNLNSKDFESWVEGAWKEVLASRGEAISDGLHHSSEYEEHVYQAIKKLLKSTHESPKSLMGKKFNIYINSEKCDVELHKISSVEFGYDVPQKLLKQIITAQESSFYK
jgi:hypothetical protein